jgi:hypothetical protein
MEALACQARVAAGYYVDNQMELHNYLVQNKLILGLGCLLEFSTVNKMECSKIDFSAIDNIVNITNRSVECFKFL